jgi:hypothetical protein
MTDKARKPTFTRGKGGVQPESVIRVPPPKPAPKEKKDKTDKKK